MINFKTFRKPQLLESIILIIIVLSILGGMMIFVPNITPHIPIIITISFLLLYGLYQKVSYKDMQDSMIKSVGSSMGAIYLFFFIGILITALMMSGSIPTLMYYGLNIISEKTFYLSAFLITAVIGVSIGSSLTTVATLGVALIGIAQAFEANLAITAGAIVSGAFFGDKMSPLSDTTSISASIVEIDLFEHIKNMMRTTIPVFILSAIFYLILSRNIQINNLENIESFKQDIFSTGMVHIYALIPFVILIILAVFKVPAVISIIITTIISTIITSIHTSYNVEQLTTFFYAGFSSDNISENVASLIQRGGINSMFFTLSVVILALSLGGLLFSLGIISTILESIANSLKSKLSTTLTVALTAVGLNFTVGEQYLSILLTGKTFKPVYDKLKLHPKNLARTLEDAGTVINPLVPWSVCGVFISNALGVSVFSYLPFAFFCYGSFLITILAGFNNKSK
ncbi:Na+/H+ antiporter NhaC [Gemelliphila palaticanis]|uniref:Na+/H+ antiporter NhaC n=1 Tax=Gemelliphila palaticanis TaxID=81950 RepID=A0ABX2SYD2_9BACL|nr:Na+/H+ antiporter NhaC [Gemella palaticanis]MBF0715401.1 Na+/H+ antiporter NhaC [Gemella palaticanis]NYS47331.1 Na+/H+ antiporter NhaC [Gemella palaticanis]